MTFDMEYLDTYLLVDPTYKVDYHPSYKML
jgi:hypothetical protein